ncbi:MAG: helix-turn-helix protein [Chthonomonadales bacterium]|nr:helix-turn-helix protein [Chthonomonadales bacterium]
MIRTEQEYQEAIRRYKEDLDVNTKMRAQFREMGLNEQETEKAMEPLLCFESQLAEEITWYENVIRGHIAPTKRLTDTGRLLIALRIARHMTQKQLAQRLGVSEANVSRDERNEYHAVTVEKAQRILDALGVSVTTQVDPLLPESHHSAVEPEANSPVGRR